MIYNKSVEILKQNKEIYKNKKLEDKRVKQDEKIR